MNIGDKVRAHIIQKYGTQQAAAKAWGVSTSMVSQVVHGVVQPPAWILEDMGLERKVTYVPKEK